MADEISQDDALMAVLNDDEGAESPVEEATPAEPESQEKPEETKEAPAEEPKQEEAKPTEEQPEEAEQKPEENQEEEAQPETEEHKERARRDYADRQRIRESVRQYVDQVQPQLTQERYDELQEEGYSEEQIRLANIEQQMQQDRYITHVTEVTNSVKGDFMAVQKDFDVFNPKSPDYDEGFTQRVAEGYERRAGLQYVEGSNLIANANEPLYDYFKEMAGIREESIKLGAVKGQKDTERQYASAESPTGASPTTSAKEEIDPVLKVLLSDD